MWPFKRGQQAGGGRPMLDYTSQMTAIIGSAPADLVAYYTAGIIPDFPASRIHCLPFHNAHEYSQKMQGISAVDRLGLWMLDDANDSNPFAYISKGPCAGMVIHFSHDSEAEIAFSALKGFLAALHDAGARGLDIDEITKEPIRVPLDHTIQELAAEGTDDATFLLNINLPITSFSSAGNKGPAGTSQRLLCERSRGSFPREKPLSPGRDDCGTACQRQACPGCASRKDCGGPNQERQ